MQPANDNRPPEFDRQIAAVYPRLLQRARRFTRDYESVAHETVAYALRMWATFRQTPGEPYRGFYTWLCWTMFGIMTDHTNRTARQVLTVSTDAVERPPEITSEGGQEAHVDLSTVLGWLDERERDVMLRRAAGCSGKEVAGLLGLSQQRVSQIEAEARAKILAAVNDNSVRKRAA
jgi:RNA polymerase sigma factor (sigma-70 family)